MPETPSSPRQELHLRDYLRPVLERKWLIIVIVALVTGGTYVYYSRQPRVYEASTSVYLGTQASQLGTAVLPPSQRTVQDEATLLVSEQVADAVATKLGRPGTGPGLAASVIATPSATSDFIGVTAQRGSGADAANVANGFARAFIAISSQQQKTQLTAQLHDTLSQLSQLPRGTTYAGERAQLNGTISQLRLLLAAPTGGITQLDAALAPSAPVAPRPLRNAVFGFALALLASVGAAYGLERFDRRLRNTDEIGPAYGLTPLAVLPHSSDLAFKVDGLAALGPDIREAFRQLRTGIQLAAADRPIKRILVTSAVAGEGKSTVVRNLALALHEWGHRVAVVDADLRRPTMVALFNEPHEYGLTTVLTGSARLSEALVVVPVHSRGVVALAEVGGLSSVRSDNGAGPGAGRADAISLLTSGPLATNAQAILAADRMQLLLKELGAGHDIVLIDSPPILLVSDAVSLIRESDAVIIVSRLGLTTRDNARNASDLLARIPGAHPIGVVINDVSAFEGYGYGYGYGYGAERA